MGKVAGVAVQSPIEGWQLPVPSIGSRFLGTGVERMPVLVGFGVRVRGRVTAACPLARHSVELACLCPQYPLLMDTMESLVRIVTPLDNSSYVLGALNRPLCSPWWWQMAVKRPREMARGPQWHWHPGLATPQGNRGHHEANLKSQKHSFPFSPLRKSQKWNCTEDVLRRCCLIFPLANVPCWEHVDRWCTLAYGTGSITRCCFCIITTCVNMEKRQVTS